MNDLIHVSRLSDHELSRAFRCRALPLSALVRQLHESGLAADVREHALPDLRAWIDRPPSAMRWIPAVALERLLQAIERCTDADGIRALARRSIRRDDFSMVARVAQFALSASRVDHHWLAHTLVRALKRQVRGMEIRYEGHGDSGRFEIAYMHLSHVRETSFAYWQGLVEGVYLWTGTELELGPPRVRPMRGGGIAGSFDLRPAVNASRPGA